MAELKDNAYISYKLTILPVCSSNINQEKSYARRNKSMKSWEHGTYPYWSKRSLKSYLYSYASGYNY